MRVDHIPSTPAAYPARLGLNFTRTFCLGRKPLASRITSRTRTVSHMRGRKGGGMSGGLRSRYASACAAVKLCCALLFLLASAGPAVAAEDQHEASTSQAARQEAARAIPLARIDPEFRKPVSEVLDDPSIFRRLPTSVVDCRPELFTYFAQNPEVLTEIWRELGVSRVELVRTGDRSFDLRDNAGTTGKLFVVEETCDAAAQNRVVMYAEGSYDGKPFTKPVGARVVILLRSGSMRETNGRTYVAARLDSFVKLDRTSVEIMAQVAHPFVGKTADRNFADTLSFVSNFSYTAERRPDSIIELSGQLDVVEAPRRTRLAVLARECAEAGAAWEVSRAEQGAAELPAK
jgi:hypothetical protein